MSSDSTGLVGKLHPGCYWAPSLCRFSPAGQQTTQRGETPDSSHPLTQGPATWAEFRADSLSVSGLVSGGAVASGWRVCSQDGSLLWLPSEWQPSAGSSTSRLQVGGLGPSPWGLLHRPLGFFSWHGTVFQDQPIQGNQGEAVSTSIT